MWCDVLSEESSQRLRLWSSTANDIVIILAQTVWHSTWTQIVTFTFHLVRTQFLGMYGSKINDVVHAIIMGKFFLGSCIE